MLFRKNIIIILFVFFLQSCGFQPLYNIESLSGFIVNEPNNKSESSLIIYKGLDGALKPLSKSNNKPPGLALENPSSVTYLLKLPT